MENHRVWNQLEEEFIIGLYKQDVPPRLILEKFKEKFTKNIRSSQFDNKLQKLRRAGRITQYQPRVAALPKGVIEVKPAELNPEVQKHSILDWLKSKPLTVGEISRRLDKSKETVIKLIDGLREDGYDVHLDKARKQVVLEREPSRHFTPFDIKKIYRNKIKFSIVSDTHIGSKFQQLTLLHTAYKLAEEEKVEFMVHGGDVVDGIGMYKGQDQELFLHGADEQRDYVVENYPYTKKFKTHICAGNHDEAFKKIAGYNIVRAICQQRDDLSYEGSEGGSFTIRGLNVEILHPSGGVSYARSYHLQHAIESLIGNMMNSIRETKAVGKLPHIFIQGHYHISNHLPYYMGLIGINAPCFQTMTPYLKRKRLAPEVGMIFIEVTFDNKGNVVKIVPDFRNFAYLAKENDY